MGRVAKTVLIMNLVVGIGLGWTCDNTRDNRKYINGSRSRYGRIDNRRVDEGRKGSSRINRSTGSRNNSKGGGGRVDDKNGDVIMEKIDYQ